MNILVKAFNNAKKNKGRVVFPENQNPKILYLFLESKFVFRLGNRDRPNNNISKGKYGRNFLLGS